MNEVYNSGMTCLFCGKEIVISTKNIKKDCFICKSTEFTTEFCEDGHYICKSCTSTESFDLIEKYCLNTIDHDPYAIANMLFKIPEIKMHGQEHHYIVPAVLLASYFNTYPDESRKVEYLKSAKSRAMKMPAGMCGFMGACGAAIGCGIFISLLTSAQPTSDLEWQLSNLLTANALKRIALVGGPRCCKRDTYLAIDEALKFLEFKFAKKIQTAPNNLCEMSHKNNECLREGCMYNTINTSL